MTRRSAPDPSAASAAPLRSVSIPILGCFDCSSDRLEWTTAGNVRGNNDARAFVFCPQCHRQFMLHVVATPLTSVG